MLLKNKSLFYNRGANVEYTRVILLKKKTHQKCLDNLPLYNSAL